MHTALNTEGLILLLPTKPDPERDAVADAWVGAGGLVERLDRFWDPPAFPAGRVRVYGPSTFALVVAQKLEIELAEPDPYAIVRCPPELLGRAVALARLEEAPAFPYPCFLKPVIPKQFTGKIYRYFEELQTECHGLDGATELVRSEIVTFVAEARSFLLDGVVQSCAIYEGAGSAAEAAAVAAQVAARVPLPRAVVVDVGLLANGTWVFVEANAAWGAGLNGCDPQAVLACLCVASGPPA